MSDQARLSKMLWACREEIEMWADVVENRTGKEAKYLRDLVKEIDTYRTEQGWSPDGFGNEE